MDHTYPIHFARFYDLIYHRLREGEESSFFLNKINNTKGKILEAGVGTGRFFKKALEQDADIYGFDLSESMLEILRGKVEPGNQNRISLQNIIDFRYDFKFDLIIAPFRVFMHLLDKGDQLMALNNACEHLNPGGTFVFDCFVPNLKQLDEGLNNITDFDGEYKPGFYLKRIVSTRPDLINQQITVTFRLEWEEETGLKKDTWTLPLRFFFRFELEHLIERSAFEEYKILGDYQGNDLKKDSKEFIVVCRKKKE